VVAILVLGLGDWAIVLEPPVVAAGVLFFTTFGVWFLAVGSVVALTRLIRRNLKGEHHQ